MVAGPMVVEAAPFGGLYFSIHSEDPMVEDAREKESRKAFENARDARWFPLSDGSGYFLSPTWVRARDALIGSGLTVGCEVPGSTFPDDASRFLVFRGGDVVELSWAGAGGQLLVSDFKRAG